MTDHNVDINKMAPGTLRDQLDAISPEPHPMRDNFLEAALYQAWRAGKLIPADEVLALTDERDALRAEVERLKARPVTVQDAARDADLLLSAYSAVIVLNRMLDRAGLARATAVARKIADEIVAAHPEFPGLTALRAITEGRE